jgi:mono/diheme cytochrome c family protein
LKILRALSRAGLAGLVFYAALKEIARPSANETIPTVNKFRLILKTSFVTAVVGIVLLIGGGLAFAFSGLYPLQADTPHLAAVWWLLKRARTRSVKFHSQGIQTVDISRPQLVKHGFGLFRTNCQTCHGAPGIAADQVGLGINPKPPRLITTNAEWTDAQLFWIISHGLKMSGMPAFSPRLSDTDRWSLVAFVRRLSVLSPADYQQLAAASDQGLDPMSWGTDDRPGFAQLRNGNPVRGKGRLVDYGCSACHTIPALGAADVGPPLTAFAEREYVAGVLVNVPTNTISWIINPRKFKPKTAMPVLGVNARDALDMAAYLYTLGSPKRIRTIERGVPHP